MAKQSKSRLDSIKNRLKRGDIQQKNMANRQPILLKKNDSRDAAETWQDREVRDDFENQADGKPSKDPAGTQDVGEKLIEFANAIIPRMTQAEKLKLQDILSTARSSPPKDKQLFVTVANRLLDVFQLRVRADGELYRLRVLPGSTGRGHIQLVGKGRGIGRGFKNAAIDLVPAESEILTPF